MNKKQFEALVNKGAVTHVGIAADVEKLSDKELCEKFVTKHEVAAEVLSGKDEAPVVPEEVAPETPSEPVAPEVPEEPTTPVEEAAPVALAAEEPVATTTKKSTKKTTKKDVEVVDEAPVVDPVTE